jgi:hypothetical protein
MEGQGAMNKGFVPVGEGSEEFTDLFNEMSLLKQLQALPKDELVKFPQLQETYEQLQQLEK